MHSSSTPSNDELPTDASTTSTPADHKFVARTLQLGKPEEATDLQHALGLDRQQYANGYAKGEHAIIEEFEGPSAREEDKANLHYVLNCKVVPDNYPLHVQKQIEEGRYHGGELKRGDFDRGHDGMCLDDFVAKANKNMGTLPQFVTRNAYAGVSNPEPKPIRP